MTDVHVEPVLVGPPHKPERGARRRWLVITVVALLVAAGLAVGLWVRWLYSANALRPSPTYQFGGETPIGTTFYFPDMVVPNSDKPTELDLRSVTPHITRNTGRATIKVLICRRNNSISRLGSDDLEFCSTSRPFRPGVVTLGPDAPGTDSIVLAITTPHLGKLTIDGVDVDYRQGIRHGRQRTGGQIRETAGRPTPPPPPVTRPPTITAISPASGTTAGGTRVVIRGTNFTDLGMVRFGTVTLPGKDMTTGSRRELVLLTPAHTAGTVQVRVVTNLGVSPTTPAARFTYR